MNLKTKTPIYNTSTVKVSELPNIYELDDSAVFLVVSKNGTRKISYKTMYDYIKTSILNELNLAVSKITSEFKTTKANLLEYKKNNTEYTNNTCNTLKKDLRKKTSDLTDSVNKKINEYYDLLKNEFNSTIEKINSYNIPFFNKTAVEIKNNVENIKKQISDQAIATKENIKTLSSKLESTTNNLDNNLKTNYNQINAIISQTNKQINNLSTYIESLEDVINKNDKKTSSMKADIDKVFKKYDDTIQIQLSNITTDLSQLQTDLSVLDIQLYGLTLPKNTDISNINVIDGDINKLFSYFNTLSSMK